FTIHKKIYRARSRSDGTIALALQNNRHTNTLFIVDEASMIQYDTTSNDFSLFSKRKLLDDLFTYVQSGDNCKLLFIGDTAQLPPVGLSVSPALDAEFLKRIFNYNIEETEMTEVVRQSEDSGILRNATEIRQKISREDTAAPFFTLDGQVDVVKINGLELEDALNDMYSKYGIEESVIITRSNKRANIFNREIRNRILFREEEVAAGDIMMVVRNNYFWLDPKSEAGFIANGDIIEILKIRNVQEIYGFHFADVVVRLVDYPEEKELETRLLLDTITADSPALTFEDSRMLFDTIIADYADLPGRRNQVEKVKINPYYNALQVKFAYSLTCHKTQGGQWRSVFIDQGYLTDEMINTDYLRWLYTAVTRATDQLYLVNFNDRFFSAY
ncbi:MAG: ATP-dependent helicase, partial [Bacteroidales bacterium]|nr:ATP-dependent helicase [Bacteroidales bacterium]